MFSKEVFLHVFLIFFKHSYLFDLGGVENFRYNKNPSKENPITNPNPLPYDLDGNFIIDKNINNGNFAPTSFLIPEPHYNFFSSQANSQQNYPQFLEKSISKSSNPDNFQTNSYKFIEKKKDYNGFNDIECLFINFLVFLQKK